MEKLAVIIEFVSVCRALILAFCHRIPNPKHHQALYYHESIVRHTISAVHRLPEKVSQSVIQGTAYMYMHRLPEKVSQSVIQGTAYMYI